MRKFKCEICKKEYSMNDVYYVLSSDTNGSNLQMLCKVCTEMFKSISPNKRIRVFDGPELRGSFE